MNRINNILVIVDPTAAAHPAVDKAALLAQQMRARIELFVCDTKAAREMRVAAHLRSQPEQPLLTNYKALLEALARPLRERGLDVTTEVECGEPLHAALVDRTKRASADLVVKDTHHHSIAQRTFFTNTDWTLIRSCPAPLLLTKDRRWGSPPRILAAVDPSHANDKPSALDHRILEHAAFVAKELKGELYAVHAHLPVALIAAATGGAPPMALSVSADDMARAEADVRKQLAALVGPYGVEPARTIVELGAPSLTLTRTAESMHADILLMGAISRSGLKRIFIGATAEDVLERLPCDALIVKPPDFAAMLPF